ncbi:MAG: hypothetical protein BGO01_19165 [Armatimonadetes bacterium 55-13]|nr:MarR family transcriptional regulator [Armatimonadota bacterium]OJU64241.1 MAG: hypothetical protein BGO01_19165 [Armatimonadetes bacterium 55-13]
MSEDLREVADQFETVLSSLLRQLFHVNENEPLSDLPLMQLRVVKGLYPDPKLVSAVAKELRMSASRLAHLLARLEDAGLVRRYDDEKDRRVRYAELTEQGISLMRQRRALRNERTVHLFERLTSAERDQVMCSLRLLLGRAGTLQEPMIVDAELEQELPR